MYLKNCRVVLISAFLLGLAPYSDLSASDLTAAKTPSNAAYLNDQYYRDITFFGGVMTEGGFPGTALVPLAGDLEDIAFAGVAFNQTFFNLGAGFKLGGEIGLGGRFGNQVSADLWFGPSLRHHGFQIGSARLTLGATAGFSAVTSSSGIERVREIKDDGDAAFVYYLGPEVGLVFGGLPKYEFLFRVHHRSGGANVFLPAIGNMGDASNAYLIGVRRRF